VIKQAVSYSFSIHQAFKVFLPISKEKYQNSVALQPSFTYSLSQYHLINSSRVGTGVKVKGDLLH